MAAPQPRRSRDDGRVRPVRVDLRRRVLSRPGRLRLDGERLVHDRTVRYLASGRPAVVQDTTLERALPIGDGLLTFRTASEAADRALDVVARYETHRRAARAIAEEFFSPEAALAPLFDATGVAP